MESGHALTEFEGLLIDPAIAVNPLTRAASRQFISTKRGDQSLVAFLNHVFAEAAAIGASDVHFLDGASYMTVRYRQTGVLRNRYFVAPQTSQDVDHKVRARSKLDPTERISPLDGKFWFDLGDRMLDVRVSVLPTRHGQTIVCRLLDQANASRQLAHVEMPADVRAVLMRLLTRSEGLILVTGPTGSGKTSTLYAALNHLNTADIHIVTAEDPIEYELPGTTQVQVEGAQRSFARVLRAFLRQDFNVGLVGEIRDGETASVTLQASNTGHLMLSTLHTNDGPSTLTRLIDLGVEQFALGSALLGIVAQRLEPKLCPHCAIEHELTAQERERLEQLAYPVEGPFWRANHAGCEHCHPALPPGAVTIGVTPDQRGPFGEKGRIPIIALIEGTRALRQAIQYGQQNDIMPAIESQPQYRPLNLAALDLSVAGKLDFHCALRMSES